MNTLQLVATVYFSGVITVWVITFLWVNISVDNVTVGEVLPISFLSWIVVLYMVWFFIDTGYNHIKNMSLKLNQKPKTKNQFDKDWHLEKVKENYEDLI